MGERWEGKWIHIDFLCKTKSGKTSIYQVASDRGHILGDIKWYAQWRKYAFFPETDGIYEQDCLQDIAKFLILLKGFKCLKK